MNQRSRSTLFLIEQLIVVAVFAICSAACVRILTSAFLTARESKEVSNAILVAESAAESFKAVSGDIGKAAGILTGSTESSNNAVAVVVYYDKHLRICGINDAYYVLSLTIDQQNNMSLPVLSGNVLVENLTGEKLVEINVAARSHAAG